MSGEDEAGSLADWRALRPDLALAEAYIAPSRRAALAAHDAIVRQWSGDIYAVSERHVLEAKLGWWGEEIRLARSGHARHPLSAALFAWSDARELPEALWSAILDAALTRRGARAAADFAAQQRALAPYCQAVARAETALWFGPDVDPAAAQTTVMVEHLLNLLAWIGSERCADALPMQLLARHALDRAALAVDGVGRDAAVRDQLAAIADLAAAIPEAPLGLFRSLAARGDAVALRRARRAGKPLAALFEPKRPTPKLAWRAWRDARGLRRAGWPVVAGV